MNKTDLDLLELTTIRQRLLYLKDRLKLPTDLAKAVYSELEDERISLIDRIAELESYHGTN